MKKRLIYNYDEKNDTFVGSVSDEHGFIADYGICDDIFLGLNNFNLPTSVYVSNASEILDIPKHILETANIKIQIDCSEKFLDFSFLVDDLKIFSTTCKNTFGMPPMNFLINGNF